MRARGHLRIAAALLAALLIGGSCSSFQSVTAVVDLRVLDIRADPPEIYVDDPNQPDPMVSTLTALVVDPLGQGRAVSYSALACPREIDSVTAATGRNGVVCAHNLPGMPPNSLELIPPDMPLATSDPGPEHDIGFDLNVSRSLLETAFTLDPYGAQGFQLPIVVQMELAAGSESIVTTKRVIFSRQLDDRPPQTPNANPAPDRISVYPARDAQRNPVSPVDLDENAPIGIQLGGQLWFEPVGAIAEAYATRALTRDDPPQVVTLDVPAETLRYAFFTSVGYFAPAETSTVVSLIRDEDRPHVEAQYNAPTVMPDDPTVTIWIATHDERGGTSWTKRQLTLLPP
jgi:hypothetical protein